MTTQRITIETWLAALDEKAADSEDPHALYSAYGLMFAIWSGGGIPTPRYNPNNSPELRPLFRFFCRVDRAALRAAVDERMIRTAPAVAA